MTDALRRVAVSHELPQHRVHTIRVALERAAAAGAAADVGRQLRRGRGHRRRQLGTGRPGWVTDIS
jgi:hypothetical protein